MSPYLESALNPTPSIVRAFTRRRLPALVFALACFAFSVSALAAPDLSTLPVPKAPPSSTNRLAVELVRGLYPKKAPKGVGRFAVEVTYKGPARHDAEALAAHLGDAVEAAARSLTTLSGRVPKSDAREVIEIHLTTKRGHLSATARRVVLPLHFWARLKFPTGRVVATAYTNVSIDLELRTLLGLGRRPVRLDALRAVAVSKRSAKALLNKPILDLAIDDLDNDRHPEVAVLHHDRVSITRWARGGFAKVHAEHRLGGGPARARVRHPIGRLVVGRRSDGDAELLAASSDRGAAERLRFKKGALTADKELLRAWPLFASATDRIVTASWPEAIDTLEGPLSLWELGGGRGAKVGFAAGVYDIRSHGVITAASPGWQPVFVATDVESVLHFREADQTSGAIGKAGTVAVAADVDGDGRAEILTTSSSLEGPDRLALHRLTSSGKSKVLWRHTLPHSVTAAAAGDVDRDGFVEFVVATWDGKRAGLTIVVPRDQ